MALCHCSQAVIHVHTLIEECEVVKLVSVLDPKTKEKKKVQSYSWSCCSPMNVTAPPAVMVIENMKP